MERPYIFCHMLISLDGKIDGPYMETPACQKSIEIFNNISFGPHAFYKHQGWLSGRTTTDDNFTHYKSPKLVPVTDDVPTGDFIAHDDSLMCYISIDPSGRLGWETNFVKYADTKAHVIEVLTEKASAEYKQLLRNLNISYIIVGKEAIDPTVTIQKLQKYFKMETIMLGGGGVLNWSFIEAGLCDELSLVVAPVADGSSDSPSLFTAKAGLSQPTAREFKLLHNKVYEDGTIWLQYKV